MFTQDQQLARHAHCVGEPSRSSLGAVYTPDHLAEWVAGLLLEMARLPAGSLIIDPACGAGALLGAVRRLDPRPRLAGLEIDRNVVKATHQGAKADYTVTCADALDRDAGDNGIPEWSQTVGDEEIDAVIANPPWGATLSKSRCHYAKAGYALARGQFDSWNLFVEATLRNVRPNGHAAFILPDALFSNEHAATRALLQERTQLRFVARLGEGFFPNVYRAVSVIVFKNSRPRKGAEVEVLRIRRDDRKRILEGDATFEAVRRRASHKLAQSSFAANEGAAWTVDRRAGEESFIERFTSRASGSWTDELETGRGVELSKHGKVMECPSCGHSHPATKRSSLLCKGCGHEFPSSESRQATIVEKRAAGRHFFPFLVGEDVNRYIARPGRYIRTGVAGINYKDRDVFSKRRLLFRKTGLGLRAAIVDTPCMTNQVVFHYFVPERSRVPGFYLSYLLGVLSSRTLLAYHLQSSGDTEWRSHPYVTQRTIAGLPVPEIREGERSWKQARAIAGLVDRMLDSGSLASDLDHEIERLVAALYGFDESSFSWVQAKLESAQALEPFRAMKIPAGNEIVPKWAA